MSREFLQRRNVKYSWYQDQEFADQLKTAVANAMTVNNLNILNPLSTELTNFNRHSFPINEPPIVGKTVIFMTRPDLNFQNHINLSRVGFFDYLLRSDMGKQVLHSLMSAQRQGYVGETGTSGNMSGYSFYHPIPQDKQIRSPFMPIVSNLCVNTSGAKDIIIDVEETQGDFSGNKLGYAKGGDETFNTGAELTLSFHDVRKSPVMMTFLAWMTYIHYVTKGIVHARRENIIDRVLDYTCSIYIGMLDNTQTRILRFIRYVGCFPRSLSYGAVQHSADPNAETLRDVEVSMYCNGYEPFNPMNFSEFNLISAPFLSEGARSGTVDFDRGNGNWRERTTKSIRDIEHDLELGADDAIIKHHHDNNFNGHPYIVNTGESEFNLIYV